MKKLFFAAFIGALLIVQAPFAASAACVSVSGNLYRGLRSSDVRALQEFLVTRNYPGGGDWMITGFYGPATEAAVRNFQRESNLAVTGSVDSATRDAIVRISCGVSGGTTGAAPWYQPFMNLFSGLSFPQAYPTTPSYPSYPTYPTTPTYPTYPMYPYTQNAPYLTSLSVNTGGPGTVVTIWGSNFDTSYNTVYFGSVEVPGVSSNGTSLTFTVPSQSSSGITQVKVGNSRGMSNALTFNFTSNYYYPPYQQYPCGVYPYTNCGGPIWGGTPTITYLSPSNGAVGATVTVYGSGFSHSGNTVRFGNGIIANVSSNDGRAVTFQVPTTISGYGSQTIALTTYDVSVTNAEGRTSNRLPFTVTSLGSMGQPTITNVTGPTSLTTGTVGTWTLTANNPGGGYLTVAVDWGDAGVYAAAQPMAQSTYLYQQTLSFTHTYYQTGTYTVRFTVTNQSGQSNITTTTVNVTGTSQGTVSLSSMSPSSGRVGQQVVLTGTGFTQDNAVHFGIGGTQHLQSYNGTTIYYTIPAYVSPCDLILPYGQACAAYVQMITPGTYPVYVTNGNGTTQQQTFTVTQ